MYCRLHHLPYPGSAYWTRRSLGLPAELPALPEGIDEIIEIVPVAPKLRRRRTRATDTKGSPSASAADKPRRIEHHTLLSGVEEHFRKSRTTKDGEFLRPYKRILPDVMSSDEALSRALSIANRLYLALDRFGHRVQIAQAGDSHHRIQNRQQEVERKDRTYGAYNLGSFWTPGRPTVVFIDTVPIGLTVTEMTERVTMRYVNGGYHREDSKLVRSMKASQLTDSWTTEQDMPSGRFRIVAYSPRRGVTWSLSWQDTETEPLIHAIPNIVETLRASRDKLQALMAAEDAAEAKRKKEQQEEWERYERREDELKVAQAIKESHQQLAEIIESWGRAMVVERFFQDVEVRLTNAGDEQRRVLAERVTLARQMMGNIDPLELLQTWRAPEDRYRSRFDDAPRPPPGGRSDKQ